MSDPREESQETCCGQTVATDHHRWKCPTCAAIWVWDEDAARFFRAFPIESLDDLNYDIEIGARALVRRWDSQSVLNQCPDGRMWTEARLTAAAVLRAVQAAHSDGEADAH